MSVPPRRVRLREIALRANCSIGTVSMALNDRPELPESTRKRIQEIADELGYVANRLAKSLSLGRTGVIGVVMPFSIDSYYAAVLDALNSEAEARGYQLQIQFHRWAVDAEERAIRRLAESRVDGILLYPARNVYEGTPLHQWLEATRMPLVSLSKKGDDLPSLAGRIMKDYATESEIVARELIALGHRKIDLLVYQVKGTLELHPYERIFEIAREEPGLEVQVFQRTRFEEHETIDFYREKGLSSAEYHAVVQRLVEGYLEWPDRGTAVIAGNNDLAWKLVAALRRCGVGCPEEVSVTSTGFLGHGAGGGIALSAAEYNPAQIAQLALDALLLRIEKGTITGPMVVKPELCLRETTGPLVLTRSP